MPFLLQLQQTYYRRLSQPTLAKLVCHEVAFCEFMIELAGGGNRHTVD